VHNEEDAAGIKEERPTSKLISLNVVDRLAGELESQTDEAESSESRKLALESRFGGDDAQPIVEIAVLGSPDELQEGWKLIEGTINETGEDKYLAVKHAKPHPSLQYVTSISVS